VGCVIQVRAVFGLMRESNRWILRAARSGFGYGGMVLHGGREGGAGGEVVLARG
jgi:hypothetical protein